MANIKYDLPLILLRDVVVFPGVVTTLFVGRNKSINALNASMAGEKKIILAAQKDGSLDAPLFDDLYKTKYIRSSKINAGIPNLTLISKNSLCK